MAEATKSPTACLIIIGNEILSGRTQDVNLQFIATGLNEVGVRLAEARVVPDQPAVIIATVNECRAAHDYVFTTGGIGPTHDDITSECIAAAFGVALHHHPEAVRLLSAALPPGGLNEARMRMATVPEGAELIHNPVSVAPGYRIENVYVMAGVPQVMRAMFDGIRQSLAGGTPVQSREFRIDLGEGVIAAALGELQRRFDDVDIGSYPGFRGNKFGVAVVLRGTDAARLEAAAVALVAALKALGGNPEESRAGAGDSGASASAPS